MSLRDRIDAIEPDAELRPLPIHGTKHCHIVHPGRTHRVWWEAVKNDREQRMRDHWPLWDQTGVSDPARVSSGNAAGTDALDPSS